MVSVQAIRLGKASLHRHVWLAGLLLLFEGLKQPPALAVVQEGQSKASSSASASIPKGELDIEAELKRVMQDGHNAYRAGKYDGALSRFQEALKLTKTLDPKIAGNVLIFTTDDALAQMGNCQLQLHQLEDAQSNFRALLEWRKQNLRYDSSVAVAFENLAVVDTMQNDFAKAGDHLKQGITYVDECISHFKSSDAYSPQDIVANDDRRLKSRLKLELANVYANQGKYDDALSACEEAFQIGDKFRSAPKAQLQIVSTAITVAKLANRADKVEMWEQRNKSLQEKKD